MKNFLLVILILGFFCSCSKYDLPKCEFNDATQDLEWLKDLIDTLEANPSNDTKYFYLVQGKVKRKTVFFVDNCHPTQYTVPVLLDCEGMRVKDEDGNEFDVANGKIKNKGVIWQPEDFGCEENGNTINM